jgi:hypothetical protein
MPAIKPLSRLRCCAGIRLVAKCWPVSPNAVPLRAKCLPVERRRRALTATYDNSDHHAVVCLKLNLCWCCVVCAGRQPNPDLCPLHFPGTFCWLCVLCRFRMILCVAVTQRAKPVSACPWQTAPRSKASLARAFVPAPLTCSAVCLLLRPTTARAPPTEWQVLASIRLSAPMQATLPRVVCARVRPTSSMTAFPVYSRFASPQAKRE